MEGSPLYNLIQNIEYGTNLHIGVLFFKNYGNQMCELPKRQEIHQSPLCDTFKTHSDSAFKRCLRCRNLALNKALSTKKAFGGLCINGIYEYTHPVIINGNVACVIFIGNIATNEGISKIETLGNNLPLNTLEHNFNCNRCESVCKNIEEYIIYLLEKFPNRQTNEKPLIKNIKAYIQNNIDFEINIKQIANAFHYNPRYLGRLFKQETGDNINDYIIRLRLKRAMQMLSDTEDSIIAISTESGFNNVTYFNRLFKNRIGLTPTEYRKEIRK